MPTRKQSKLLFAAWIVTLPLLLAGGALTLWNLPLLRERANLLSILKPDRVDITLGMLLDESKTPTAEREQIRNAYEHPDQIDLNKISWNLRSRPTPFVGGAPDPGLQTEGSINDQQMRDERQVTMPKPAGVYRIFLTGGSFAYSVGVDPAHAISRLLEEELNRRAGGAGGRKFEVWNAAVPSWASTHERIWIENRLSALDPDLVIMLTGTNECHWGFGRFNVMDLRIYDDEEYFALINGARQVAGLKPYSDHPPQEEPAQVTPGVVAERFAKNVRLAAEALAPERVPLLVALQPSLTADAKTLTAVERDWIEHPRPENIGKIDYMDQCFAAMEKAVRPLSEPGRWSPGNLHLVSLRQVFAGRSDAIFLDMYHVGDKGNALVAKGLADAVIPITQAPQPQ